MAPLFVAAAREVGVRGLKQGEREHTNVLLEEHTDVDRAALYLGGNERLQGWDVAFAFDDDRRRALRCAVGCIGWHGLDRDARRVIATVLEAPQATEEELQNLGARKGCVERIVPKDAAHLRATWAPPSRKSLGNS